MNTSNLTLFIIICCLSFYSCKPNNTNPSLEYFSIKGETMGTYYNIKYSDKQKRNFKPQIDSLLTSINQSLSTYIPESYISIINSSQETKFSKNTDQHFVNNYNAAKEIYVDTDGLYDPTIGAMTNYYGFGKDRRVLRENISKSTKDSLKTLVGMDKFEVTIMNSITHISKLDKNMQIDFSSIAKGYAVDEISQYLLDKDCANHLVDIGGDGLAKGISPSKQDWFIGINKPLENSPINDFALIISVSDKGLATSGNYRNFYVAGENKYAHTINPKTGLPEITTLLSTSVIADNCMLADAYATACMVMGLEKSQALIAKTEGLEACWIHDADQDGQLEMTMSKGFEVYTK